MRMNISAWAIRNPVPSLVLFMVLMTLGITTFSNMPVKRFPNIDIPVVTVQITQPGASPSELETQVTKKVEDAIAGITGVKHLLSNVVEGASTTTLEFELGIPIDRATNDVKDAVDRLRSELPSTIDDPVIQRLDIAGLPILTYGASAPTLTPQELSWLVDDTFIRELQGVKGIAQVSRIGGVTREVRIELNANKLLALGITAGEVNQQLRATNVDIAGGRAELAGRRQAIRTLAGKTSLKKLGETKIALPGGRSVRLNDLGSVSDTWEEPRFFADLNGKPAVAFSITRSKGASEIVVAANVDKAIERLRKAHPAVKLSLIDDTVSYTRGVYESTMKTLIEGAILAVFVVFIFLRDMRATVIAAIALPLSVIPTFWAMSMFGFSLNLVSLLAIT
ncbi:MAG: multidrug efflux pump subunit AcrB, partial [Hyphomicrobiaceae bacterium]